MTNSNGQLRALVERIIRLREEASNIKGDIREVYAEAKSNGYDKTILGKVVQYIEKRDNAPAEVAEADAVFELYLSAYDGASPSSGTALASHTHEASQ